MPSGRSAQLAALVAHQGGWDEILLVAGPIIVIVALLAVVKRRVDAVAAADAEHEATDGVDGEVDDGGDDEAGSAPRGDISRR